MGEEGTFVICSFWLVSCLALAGEVERAEALFARLAGFANDLGLLGEEIDTATGEQLGNFPQAFSHIGLVTAAWQIDRARERAGTVSAAVESMRGICRTTPARCSPSTSTAWSSHGTTGRRVARG